MSWSGKFVLRTSPELHRELKESASREGVSLNQLCLSKLIQPNRIANSSSFENLPFTPIGLLKYGSTVRGEQTENSDIDWLLVVPDDVIIDRTLYDHLDQLKLPDHRISLHVAHLPHDLEDLSNFWLELAVEAEILDDTHSIISKRLIAIRQVIAIGSYQRFITHGQPYWVKRKINHAK